MNYSKVLALAASVASVAFIGTASAADMAVKAPPVPAAVAIYDWTGFYIGGNVGGSWSRSNVDLYTIGGFPIVFTPTRVDVNGVLGGGQIGYNWQRDKFVFGVEADGAWRDNKGTIVLPFNNGVGDTTTFTTRQDWIATFRGRGGVAVNNWLFYVTGGAAVEELEHSFTENRTTVAGQNRTISSDDTRFGWTVGAGFEAGFGHWSAGLEYLYADFGRRTTLSAPLQVVGGLTFNPSVVQFSDSGQHILRAKLNYHFNAPVVAKY